MQTDIRSYIKVYRGVIPKELCKQTIDSLQNVKWEKHTFYNAMDGSYNSHEHEPQSYYNKVETTNSLMDCLTKSINTYVKDLNTPHWNAWMGFSYPKFNRYRVGDAMANHCDHIHSLFTGDVRGIPVLTMIGQLNTDYKGGELVFFESDEYKLDDGDVLVFPSIFLYPHRVQPVTEGVRYSLASWSW